MHHCWLTCRSSDWDRQRCWDGDGGWFWTFWVVGNAADYDGAICSWDVVVDVGS
jgi:hypothetical protein